MEMGEGGLFDIVNPHDARAGRPPSRAASARLRAASTRLRAASTRLIGAITIIRLPAWGRSLNAGGSTASKRGSAWH
jgi:hypothetical protein